MSDEWAQVYEKIMALTPQERALFVMELADRFCLNCGDAYTTTWRNCHCENDD